MSWSERISVWFGGKKAQVWIAHLKPYTPKISEEMPFAHALCGANDCTKEYVICRRTQDFYDPAETDQIRQTIIEATRACHPAHPAVLTGTNDKDLANRAGPSLRLTYKGTSS
jgi:hypothetical protein